MSKVSKTTTALHYITFHYAAANTTITLRYATLITLHHATLNYTIEFIYTTPPYITTCCTNKNYSYSCSYNHTHTIAHITLHYTTLD